MMQKIWAKAEFALKPSVARRIINLNKIGQLTKDGDVSFIQKKF